MDSTLAIETANLTKRFKRQRGLLQLLSRKAGQETVAVNEVTLQVREGEIFGLLGPNGAGKTTLVKILSTLLIPSSGAAYIHGHDVVRDAQEVKSLIGLVTSEERSFFWRLTGRQNLEFFAALYHVPRDQAESWIPELFELFGLAQMADVRFNEYSTGMRQKLAIARGLLNQPKILFMDEPTKGLDPVSAQDLLRLIQQKVVGLLRSTVLLTTHILRDVEQLCDRIAIMHEGRVAGCGTMEELRAVSRQLEHYRLKVQGLTEEKLQEIRMLSGVADCARVSKDDGVVELSIHMLKGSNALSESLKRLLLDRCEVLYCALEEEKLEELFHHMLRSREEFPLS